MMKNRKHQRRITQELQERYAAYLWEQEKSRSTIEKYIRDLKALQSYVQDGIITKAVLISWKEELTGRYAPASINSMLAAANSFLDFCGWTDCKVKPLKRQRDIFCREEKELTREEYRRLVMAAEKNGNRRLSLILQTICATGIRVSELQFITVEAVREGSAEVNCKGKSRIVFLPDKLRRLLLSYIRKRSKKSGAVFITRSGSVPDRSNIWRDMKSLCSSAGVEPGKVFPHNLRHLFARTYYSMEKDLSRLADILGHASVSTTRIYTAESGAVHRKQLEHMELIVT